MDGFETDFVEQLVYISGKGKKMENKQTTPTRDPYNTPKLTVYGDVASLTQTSSLVSGSDDGSNGANKKTR